MNQRHVAIPVSTLVLGVWNQTCTLSREIMPIKFQYEFDIVEILCTLKDDSVVHLDPSNGLNIIYGKNGSGKSSFLNALNGETKQVALLIRAPRDDDNYADSNLLIESVLEAFSAKCDEAYGIAGLEKLGEDLFLKRTPLEHWAHLSTQERRHSRHGYYSKNSLRQNLVLAFL